MTVDTHKLKGPHVKMSFMFIICLYIYLMFQFIIDNVCLMSAIKAVSPVWSCTSGFVPVVWYKAQYRVYHRSLFQAQIPLIFIRSK